MKKIIHKTKEYVERLKEKPHHTRKRLMWFYSIITIVIILFLWANHLKGQLQINFNKEKEQAKESQTAAPSLINNLKKSLGEFIEFLKPKPNFDENEE